MNFDIHGGAVGLRHGRWIVGLCWSGHQFTFGLLVPPGLVQLCVGPFGLFVKWEGE